MDDGKGSDDNDKESFLDEGSGIMSDKEGNEHQDQDNSEENHDKDSSSMPNFGK